MSEQKWTKEPWCKGDDNSPLLPCTEPRQILGQLPDGRWCVLFSGNIHFPDVIPNVDRAVACVNAMAGIPDPAAFVSRMRAMEEQNTALKAVLADAITITSASLSPTASGSCRKRTRRSGGPGSEQQD